MFGVVRSVLADIERILVDNSFFPLICALFGLLAKQLSLGEIWVWTIFQVVTCSPVLTNNFFLRVIRIIIAAHRYRTLLSFNSDRAPNYQI